MSRTREAIRILVATAVLTPVATAFLGEQAVALPHFPSVKDVAAEINTLPGIKKGNETKEGGPSAYYEGRLPHGQRVSLTLTSRTELHGKPDPGSVVALDIEIYKQPKVKGDIKKPFISIDFLRVNDGTWTAHEQQAISNRSNSTFSVEELAQQSADQQITTISRGQINVSQAASMGGQCAANFVLDGLEADAWNALTFIADGNRVPLNAMASYSNIASVACNQIVYKPGVE